MKMKMFTMLCALSLGTTAVKTVSVACRTSVFTVNT